MNQLDINQIIDLDRFPIDNPQDPEYGHLIKRGRESLESCALLSMEKFLQPHVIPLMA